MQIFTINLVFVFFFHHAAADTTKASMFQGGSRSLNCILSSTERKQLCQGPFKSPSANPHTTLTPSIENPQFIVVQVYPENNTV